MLYIKYTTQEEERYDGYLQLENGVELLIHIGMDIAAFALNRLPPRYVQSLEGKLLHRFDASTTQMDVEITAMVFKGIQIVGDDPHKNTNEF